VREAVQNALGDGAVQAPREGLQREGLQEVAAR